MDMKTIRPVWLLAATIAIPFAVAQAAHPNGKTLRLFENANQSSAYFDDSYGYAVFPTIGKGALVVGGAHGRGTVYQQDTRIGHVTMNQLSVGWQAGGEAYSEIIFFKDKAALDDFTSGNFSFSGDVGAVVITAGASASAGTSGENSAASADKHVAATQGQYQHGMAVFTIMKGGLMYNVSVEGQKFSYEPLGEKTVASNN
jgi:lipid-binding SYLF domain-containing protein